MLFGYYKKLLFYFSDVAARNILVHDRHYAKIGLLCTFARFLLSKITRILGDFGLCRFVYAEGSNYLSRGGRLPVKWMAIEAIRDYAFTSKSDM